MAGRESTRLIAGLGNPGRIYARNRHNVGFQCVDYYAEHHGLAISQRRARALIALGEVHGLTVMLAKPQTYMNESGQSVRELARWYKINIENVLVVCDDLDLPFGTIRIREKGSSGGHRGLQSIINELGTNAIPRLRVGIGRPEQGDEVAYVLNNFDSRERAALQQIYADVSAAIDSVLQEGIAAAMNRFNG